VIPDDLQVTTEMLLQGVLFFAIIDLAFVPVLNWSIKPNLFRQLKWVQVFMAGVIWFGIWSWAIGNFWETVYIYFFPAWGQHSLPLFFGLLMAVVALGLWTLALRFKLHPVVGYVLLGGLMGVCTHIWAVHRGIVSKPFVLQGTSPIAAVVIAFFEYMFYWGIILCLSALIHLGWITLRKRTS